jgi:hypothetical protein
MALTRSQATGAFYEFVLNFKGGGASLIPPLYNLN